MFLLKRTAVQPSSKLASLVSINPGQGWVPTYRLTRVKIAREKSVQGGRACKGSYGPDPAVQWNWILLLPLDSVITPLPLPSSMPSRFSASLWAGVRGTDG